MGRLRTPPFACCRPAGASEPKPLPGAVLSLPPALTVQCLPPPDPAGPWQVLPPRLLPVLRVQRVPRWGTLHGGRGEQYLLCQRLPHVSSQRCGTSVTPCYFCLPWTRFVACLPALSSPGLFAASFPLFAQQLEQSSDLCLEPCSLSGLATSQPSLSSLCLYLTAPLLLVLRPLRLPHPPPIPLLQRTGQASSARDGG